MKDLVRLLLAAVVGVSALYFVFWVGAALLLLLQLPLWLSTPLALVAATVAGGFVWRRTETLQGGLLSAIGVGAVVTGGIGFAGGFFGPLIFMPESNQGPLLGIFLTGPLGFVVGGIGGAVWWAIAGRRPKGRDERVG